MGYISRELFRRVRVQHSCLKSQVPRGQFQAAHREGAIHEQHCWPPAVSRAQRRHLPKMLGEHAENNVGALGKLFVYKMFFCVLFYQLGSAYLRSLEICNYIYGSLHLCIY